MSNYVISEAFDQLRQMQSRKKLVEDTKTKKSLSKTKTSKKKVHESKKSNGLKLLNEDLKIIMSMSSYQPWSGAVETCERIKDAGLWDSFESVLEDIYPDGITETQLNDILWFEPEWCYEMVGLSDEEEVDESLKDKEKCKDGKCKKELSEAPVYDLHPQHDIRKSFYGKAKVDTGDKNDKNKLYSYNTLVAEIKDGKPVVYGTYSVTTLRHIREWLKQNGFKADSAKQIMNDYGVKEECLEEGKKGFIRKYKGCSLHDAGSCIVATNENGTTIGDSPTEDGAEGIIDDYIKGKKKGYSLKEGSRSKRYTFSDMLKDKIDFYDSFEVKDGNGNKGTRYMLSNKLTDEQKENLSQYPNVVVSSATHKYAPEISHDSIIILNKGMRSKNESKLINRTYKINESALVEKEMSPEDKADTDVIRDVYNRVNRRSNAKITKDQQNVLDKHGIKVDKKYNGIYDRYNKTLVDQSGKDLGDRVSNYTYTGEYSEPRKIIKNDKVNLADKARKSKERGERRKELGVPVYDVPGADAEQIHGEKESRHGDRFSNRHKDLTKERKVQAKKMYQPMADMVDALEDRKIADKRLGELDKEYDSEILSAKRDYANRLNMAKDERDSNKALYKDKSDNANSRIDKLLKRRDKSVKESLLNENDEIDDGRLFDDVTEQVEDFVSDMFIQFQMSYGIDDGNLSMRTNNALEVAKDRLAKAITNGLLEQYYSAKE